MTMNNISTRDGLYLTNLTSDFTLLLNLPLLHAFGILKIVQELGAYKVVLIPLIIHRIKYFYLKYYFSYIYLAYTKKCFLNKGLVWVSTRK